MMKFKMKLDALSLIKLSSLVGLCFGIVSAPVVLLLNMSQMGLSIIPIVLIATPVVSLLNGALFGFLGYPLYSWLHNKVGFHYKGSIVFIE